MCASNGISRLGLGIGWMDYDSSSTREEQQKGRRKGAVVVTSEWSDYYYHAAALHTAHYCTLHRLELAQALS